MNRTRHWLARAARVARTITRSAWRVVTGRDSLHVLDPQDRTRLVVDTRRDR